MFKIIAGPCQLESLEMGMEAVDFLSKFMENYPVDFIFKTSFDKANRTSGDSPRGAGVTDFLKLCTYAKERNVKVITDIHDINTSTHVIMKVVDVVQIPALLSRQTDLIAAAASNAKVVNIKKGQFMSPHDVKHAVRKTISSVNKPEIWITERGSCFGYNNLVVDYRSFLIMKEENPDAKIIFDCTHSTQLPTAEGSTTGGQRKFALPLAKAAVATGAIDGLFLETHIDPSIALSDGPSMIYWKDLPEFMDGVCKLI